MAKPLVFMSDFETTVYAGQTSTEVWAAACVQLGTEDVHIFHSLPEWFDYLCSFNSNVVTYFHNLKFDGSYVLSYLLNNKAFSLAFTKGEHGLVDGDFNSRKDMKSNTFEYSISDRGQWYSITIKVGHHFIDIRDSLKLIPCTVEKIGKSFGTKHKKLSMEYTCYRYAGCEITDEEKEYIKNDVLVVKEALEIMFSQGHNKATIGGCCLQEYKNSIFVQSKSEWEWDFPNIYNIEFDKDKDGKYTHDYGTSNAGEYIRQSYRGGWCYLVKGKEDKLFHNGTTADVNSLYPSMMHSESGNVYPVGQPTFWTGNYIPLVATFPNVYFFVRLRTEFKLKEGKLPCIQIKNDLCYDSTEWLATSDIKSRVDKKYHNTVIDPITNKLRRTHVYLTLTQTDYELIKEQYELINTEILDGCYFQTKIGLFDDYINKYKKIKMESTGAVKEIAKLFLNNLYGKMATNTNSSFKFASLDEDGSIKFCTVPQYAKEPGYIPIGSAITSYARNFTIRAAQANFYGKDKAGFIYADTDSIHCDLPPSELKGIKVDSNEFCCWKLEAQWDVALFVRQKTYLEHVTHENLKPIKNKYFSIKCAGMPNKCKELFKLAIKKNTRKKILNDGNFRETISQRYGELGVNFLLDTQLKLTDFKVGLIIPTGKLLPKNIPGGVLLVDTPFCMRRKLIC